MSVIKTELLKKSLILKEVRAYDRDGYGVLKVVDPDDLMG